MAALAAAQPARFVVPIAAGVVAERRPFAIAVAALVIAAATTASADAVVVAAIALASPAVACGPVSRCWN